MQIKIKSLSFKYSDGSVPKSVNDKSSKTSSHLVLNNINLEISSGEYVTIAGTNGSGKSTLIRCIDGLQIPPLGTISVEGLDPAVQIELPKIHKKVSIVFQSPSDQIVSSSVENEIAFGLENIGLDPKEMKKRIENALSVTDLSSIKNIQTNHLSAGLQQRLCIASAIAMNPEIIAFDEATAMIDREGRKEILDLIDKLVANGTTVIHITHNVEEILRSKRTIVLNDGVVAFDGNPFDIFIQNKFNSLKLDVPFVCKISKALGLDENIAISYFQDVSSISNIFKKANVSFDSLKEIVISKKFWLDNYCSKNDIVFSSIDNTQKSKNAFEAKDVSVVYCENSEDEKTALKNINIQIPRATLTSIVGKTGSGKSTLLHCLASLITPNTGKIFIDGIDTLDKKANIQKIRMSSPLLIQRPERAIFENYCADEVAFGPRNKGLVGSELLSCVKEAMKIVSLPYEKFGDLMCKKLSGGQKRKLALASVLALKPDFLLLDEPTAGLDPFSRKEVLSIINKYVSSGHTVVMVTHKMEEAMLSDNVILLSDGLLEAFGKPEEVFCSSTYIKPFAFELLEAMK